MKHKAKNSNKLRIPLAIIFTIIIATVIPIIINVQTSMASVSSLPNVPTVSYTAQSNDYQPDMNYGTKDYWDQHYQGEKRYLTELAPKDTLEGDYFIKDDITVDASQSKCSGIIIKGNVNLYFEKEAPYSKPPTLTIKGGNGSGVEPSYPAIELTRTAEGTNRLYVQGVGKLNLEAGNKYDNDYDTMKNLMVGGNGEGSTIPQSYLYYAVWLSGDGGQGGSGTSGAAAAIGSIGGKNGEGAPKTIGRKEEAADERPGNNAFSDPAKVNGKAAAAFGDFRLSGNVELNCTGGVVETPSKAFDRSTGGFRMENDYIKKFDGIGFVEYFHGFTNGGGNGGFGFKASAIGSGGSGGSGAGAGATGACNREDTFIFPCYGNWFGVGGAGGAGTGSLFSYGGGSGKITWDKPYDHNPGNGYDFDPTNPPADKNQWCKGTKGSYDDTYEDEPRGGNGSDGGISEEAVNGGSFYSALNVTTENNEQNSQFLDSRSGQQTSQCIVYPKDEIAVKLLGSISHEEYLYEYTGQPVHPDFEVIHKPTGKVLNNLKGNLTVTYKNLTSPEQEVIDPCKAQILIQSTNSPGENPIIGQTIDGGSYEISFEYNVIKTTCTISGVNVSSRNYNGQVVEPDLENLKIVDKEGKDITDLLREYMVISYYSVDIDIKHLDSAPKDAGNYIMETKIDWTGYYACVSYSFEITKNQDIKFEIIETPTTIYGDPLCSDKDINVKIICGVTGDTEKLKLGIDYYFEYTVDKTINLNAGEYDDILKMHYVAEGPILKNYVIPKDYENIKYIVEKREASIIIDKLEKYYSFDDPVLTATSRNFLIDEKPMLEDYNLWRSPGEDVGVYTTGGSLSSQGMSKYKDNYNVAFDTSNNFEIIEVSAELIIEPEHYDWTYTYGDDIETYKFFGYADVKDIGITKKIELNRNSDFEFREILYTDNNKVSVWFEALDNGPITKNIVFNSITRQGYTTGNFKTRTTNVVVSSLEKFYKESDPDLSLCEITLNNPAIIDGKPEVLKYGIDYTLSREDGENAGTYNINIEKLTKFYTFDNVTPGKFTIKPLDVFIEGKVYFHQKGNPIPEFSSIMPSDLCSVHGIVDEGLTLPGKPTFKFFNDEKPDPDKTGITAITISYDGQMPSQNYKWAGVRSNAVFYIVAINSTTVDIKHNSEHTMPDGTCWINNKTYDALTYKIDIEQDISYYNHDGAHEPVDKQKIPSYAVSYRWYQLHYDQWIKIDSPPADVGNYKLDLVINSEDIPGNTETNDLDLFYGYKSWYFNIEKAEVTIEGYDIEVTYGETPELTATITGMQRQQKLELNTDYTLELIKESNDVLDAGTYKIVPHVVNPDSNKCKNYSFTCIDGECTVNKKPATVQLHDAGNFTQEYGEVEHTITATTSDLISGQSLDPSDYKIKINYTDAEVIQHKSAGEYTIDFEILNPAFYNNYSFSLDNPYSYQITKKSAYIRPAAKSATYGQAEQTITLDTTILHDDITFDSYFIYVDYKGQTKEFKDVGDYESRVVLKTDLYNKNYNLDVQTGTYSIVEKEIDNIIVNDSDVNYGSDPEFSYSLSEELVGDDNLTEGDDIEYQWDKNPNVGDHSVGINVAEDGTVSKNYKFLQKTPGNLHINKKPVTLTAIDKYYTYGDEEPESKVEDFELAFDEQWTMGDQYWLTVVDAQQNANRKVGSYTLKVEYDPSKTSNYDITTKNATCNVRQRRCIYTLKDSTKIYGDSDPAFTIDHWDNVVEGEQIDVEGCEFSRMPGEKANEWYQVHAEFAQTEVNKNYYFIPSDKGGLYIEKAPVTITPKSGYDSVYGAPLNHILAAVEGMKFEEKLVRDVDYSVKSVGKQELGTNLCEAVVLESGSTVLENYEIACKTAEYTVTKFKDMSNTLVAEIEPQPYTGNEVKPKVIVSYVFKDQNTSNDDADGESIKYFEEGVDYQLRYENNVEPGTATVWVEGINACEGTNHINFEILPSSEKISQTSDDSNLALLFSVFVFAAVVFGFCIRRQRSTVMP